MCVQEPIPCFPARQSFRDAHAITSTRTMCDSLSEGTSKQGTNSCATAYVGPLRRQFATQRAKSCTCGQAVSINQIDNPSSVTASSLQPEARLTASSFPRIVAGSHRVRCWAADTRRSCERLDRRIFCGNPSPLCLLVRPPRIRCKSPRGYRRYESEQEVRYILGLVAGLTLDHVHAPLALLS